jgi:hypothetical protein
LFDVIAIVALYNHPLVHVLFLEKLRCQPEPTFVDIYWEEGYIIGCSGDCGMRGGIYE